MSERQKPTDSKGQEFHAGDIVLIGDNYRIDYGVVYKEPKVHIPVEQIEKHWPVRWDPDVKKYVRINNQRDFRRSKSTFHVGSRMLIIQPHHLEILQDPEYAHQLGLLRAEVLEEVNKPKK